MLYIYSCLLGIIPHFWNSQNYFLLTGAERCHPSGHEHWFNGNIISITKKWQPAETDEERLGHPPNQCPRELPGAVPTGACPGNVVHQGPRVPARTHVYSCTQESHTERSKNPFKLIWQPCRSCCLELQFRETDMRRCSPQNVSYLLHFSKGQGCFQLYYLSFVSGGSHRCNLALFRSRENSEVLPTVDMLHSFFFFFLLWLSRLHTALIICSNSPARDECGCPTGDKHLA